VLRRLALALVLVAAACTDGEETTPPSTTTSQDLDPARFDETAYDVCVMQGESTALADRVLVAAYDTTALDMLEVVVEGPDLGILILPQDHQRSATICWYEAISSADPDTLVAVGYFKSSEARESSDPARFGPRALNGPARRA
jgi:hypothetical protein